MNMRSYSCDIKGLSELLGLVGEESRLKILCILSKGEHCVCELMANTQLSQSLISHHLSDLKEAGLVEDRREGVRAYYSLTKSGKKITKTLFSF